MLYNIQQTRLHPIAAHLAQLFQQKNVGNLVFQQVGALIDLGQAAAL